MSSVFFFIHDALSVRLALVGSDVFLDHGRAVVLVGLAEGSYRPASGRSILELDYGIPVTP